MGLVAYETFGSIGARQAEEIIADIHGWGRNLITAAHPVDAAIALPRVGASRATVAQGARHSFLKHSASVPLSRRQHLPVACRPERHRKVSNGRAGRNAGPEARLGRDLAAACGGAGWRVCAGRAQRLATARREASRVGPG
jgi:hypothetical protein